MKKTLTFLLSLVLVFSFCSKNGSSSNGEEENTVTFEVVVKKNGQPAKNIFVITTAKVWKSVINRDSGMHTDAGVVAEEEQKTTNIYGKVKYVYKGVSIPDIEGIIIDKVVLKEFSTEVKVDDEDKTIKNGKNLTVEYEIE